MSDDKDELEGSDWLSSQFTPTEQVPKQTARMPVTPPQSAEPVFGAAPARAVPAVPPTASAPAAAPPAAVPPTTAPPLAAPPVQNAAGGFNWGLRPGGGSDAAAAPTPAPAVPAAAAPPPLVTPPLTMPLASVPSAPVSSVPPASVPTATSVPSAPAPAPASEPTQPLSWSEFAATQAPPASPQGYVDEPTQAYSVPSWQPVTPDPTRSIVHDDHHVEHQEPTSAIDSLFGDHQFQEYEEVGVLASVQSPAVAGSRSAAREPRAPLATSQKALMGVALGLIGVLLLIAMFFVGEHLGAASVAAQTASSTKSSKTTPTPAGSGGPASPGVQQWSALQGGECLNPFSSPWAVTFTVVSCTNDHVAQMVFKGRLSDTDDTGYPTTSQFQTQLTALCSAPSAINYKAAAAVTDLQVSFSYPPTSASWIAGDRTYYCFVDRASGGTLPGDLAAKSAGS